MLVPAVLEAICMQGFSANARTIGVQMSTVFKAKLSLINVSPLKVMLINGLLLALPFKAAAYWACWGPLIVFVDGGQMKFTNISNVVETK